MQGHRYFGVPGLSDAKRQNADGRPIVSHGKARTVALEAVGDVNAGCFELLSLSEFSDNASIFIYSST